MNPLRRRLGEVGLLLAALLAQTSLFPQLRLFGVVPDVMVLAVVTVAAREGAEAGAAYGFAAGALIDLFLEVPLGLSALAYSVVGYGVGMLQTGLMRSTWWIGPALGGAGALASGLIFVLVGIILGQEHFLSLRSFGVIPAQALYAAVLALAGYPLASWALGPGDEAVAPYQV